MYLGCLVLVPVLVKLNATVFLFLCRAMIHTFVLTSYYVTLQSRYTRDDPPRQTPRADLVKRR